MGELPRIIEKKDSKQLTEYLSDHGQALLPMVELIEQGQVAVEQFIEVLGQLACAYWPQRHNISNITWLRGNAPLGLPGVRSGRERAWPSQLESHW